MFLYCYRRTMQFDLLYFRCQRDIYFIYIFKRTDLETSKMTHLKYVCSVFLSTKWFLRLSVTDQIHQRTARKTWSEIENREEIFKPTVEDHDRLALLMYLHVQVTLGCKMWQIPVATLQEMDEKGDYSFHFDNDKQQLPPLLHWIFDSDNWRVEE